MAGERVVDFYYSIGSRYSYLLRLRSRSSKAKQAAECDGIP